MKTHIERKLTEEDFRRRGMVYIYNDLMLGRAWKAYIKIEELPIPKKLRRFPNNAPCYRIRLIGR